MWLLTQLCNYAAHKGSIDVFNEPSQKYTTHIGCFHT